MDVNVWMEDRRRRIYFPQYFIQRRTKVSNQILPSVAGTRLDLEIVRAFMYMYKDVLE